MDVHRVPAYVFFRARAAADHYTAAEAGGHARILISWPYGTVTPARLITSAHFAISAFTNGSMSARAMAEGSPAEAAMRSFTPGSASALCTSPESFSMIGSGVLRGAQSPNQVE